MPGHRILMYIAFSLTCGCAAEDSRPALEQPAADSTPPNAAGSEQLPATAPAATVVQPTSDRKEGRYLIRTFELRPGEAFAMDTGTIKVSAIRDREIVLDRNPGTGTGFKISAEPGWDYPLGSMNNIKVLSVDHDAPSLRLELRTKTNKYLWEAWAF